MVDATTTTTIGDVADKAGDVLENIMKVEPIIAGMAGMFVPQVALVQPWILLIAPYLQRALDDIAKNDSGDALAAILELINHLTAGMQNATALAPEATTQTVVPVPEVNLS